MNTNDLLKLAEKMEKTLNKKKNIENLINDLSSYYLEYFETHVTVFSNDFHRKHIHDTDLQLDKNMFVGYLKEEAILCHQQYIKYVEKITNGK